MNKEVRKQQIIKIKKTEKPIGRIDIPWKDKLESMDVYQIPLDILVFNKYNGRILSRTKSLENQHKLINPDTKEGKKLIEGLLYDSKPQKNEETLKSLTKIGQEKVGIITEDGIIIDGNRRAMLLNRIPQIDYFKAIILPVEYDGNPLEIEKFETKYQLGEERKLDYNPIEIYLKIQQLYTRISNKKYDRDNIDKKAIKKIYEWVGNYKNINSERDIIFTLDVMNTMDDYLDTFEYNGFYTALDKREEQFRRLTDWVINFTKVEGSGKAFDGYTPQDVDDLRFIAYALRRVKYKNEKFRFLAQGHKENHFFGNRPIWESFKESHDSIVMDYEEPEINLNLDNLDKYIDGIDADFNKGYGDKIDENVDNHYQKLRNRQSQDQPKKLLNQAIDKFSAINQNHKIFNTPEVQDLLKTLGDKVNNSLVSKSPVKTMDHIISLLESISLENLSNEEKNSLKNSSKRIQQIGYQINKNL